MAERFTADLLFIIIVLLVAALLAYLIGYYVAKGRYKKQIATLEEEKTSLEEKVRKLETERLTLQGDIRRMDDEIASLKLTIGKLEKELRLPAGESTAKGAKKPEPRVTTDDLKAVTGIGPKISVLLMNRGITTWKALSETSPKRLKEILLTDGGNRFHMSNPESWPHQALLLHENREA